MSLDSDIIIQQLTLLATHRRTLAHLLQQAAQFGGEVFAPPQTANGIVEARAEIQRIKADLRESGIQMDDELNDQAPLQADLTQRAGGDVVAGDKVGGDKVMGDKRTIDTDSGDYAEGNIDKRQGSSFREDSVVFGDFVGQKTINYYQPVATLLDRQQQRNRRAMLQKVKTIWIDGLLNQSLAEELRIALDLTEQPDAVVLPLNALVQELQHPARALPTGTPIIKVFDQMGGALLILGAPGAGKTTLLLELARDLIARAEQDERHPVPVVFNLSSWATKRLPLKKWLVEELNTKYDVPRKLAQAWMDAEVVLALLDGLDEVAADYRGACVEVINLYRQEHGLVPLTVCSRAADYSMLDTKLHLQGAIIVQPLTRQQVDDYLERAGAKLVGVRTALSNDAELGKMLDTPLMLSIAALAYNNKSLAELQSGETPDERRRHLFDAYITAMFQRRSKAARYPDHQTLRWLGWLAHGMIRQVQTVFLVERFQPAWLSTWDMQLQYVLLDRVVGGLVVGLVGGLLGGLVFGLVVGLVFSASGLTFGLVGGLIAVLFGGQTNIETLQRRRIGRTIVDALVGGLVSGLVGGLVGGLIYGQGEGLFFRPFYGQGQQLGVGWGGEWGGGLLFGLVFGMLGGLLGVLTGKPGMSSRQVIVVERLRWASRKAWRSAASGLGVGLGGGLLYGLIADLVYELVLGPGGAPGGAPSVGLGVGLILGPLFGLIFGLVGGLNSAPITATIRVNQGIRRSARSALVLGLVLGLIGGLIGGLLGEPLVGQGGRLGGELVGGIVGGLGGALSFGGYACLSHLALRLVLHRSDSLPLRLVPFLDYCTERIFLRKVGGGYIFVHRLLMEHFASLYTEQHIE